MLQVYVFQVTFCQKYVMNWSLTATDLKRAKFYIRSVILDYQCRTYYNCVKFKLDQINQISTLTSHLVLIPTEINMITGAMFKCRQ